MNKNLLYIANSLNQKLHLIQKIFVKNDIIGVNSILYNAIYFLSKHNKKVEIKSNIKNELLNNINIDIDNIDYNNLINDIFIYHLINENIAVSKDYSKYYNNRILTEYIVNLVEPKVINNKLEKIFDGNVKINSYLEIVVDKFKDKINIEKSVNSLNGCQMDTNISDLAKISLLFKTNNIINLINNDILVDDIDSYDLIYFDLPTSIHNIRHASCCKKVKDLKLRGTKAEPLLLQLVMLSLNNNGRAVIVVPDSLLYSDSVQPIETRKYLLENYNVKKIVQIDELLYVNKGVKNSILYFENNGNTKDIEYSRILLENNTIKSEEIVKLKVDIFKSNNYNLNYKEYMNKSKKDDIVYKNVSELFNIYDKLSDLEIGNKKFIGLPKYYKNDSIIRVNNMNGEIFLVEKENDLVSGYASYYLTRGMKNNICLFVKGKMNQFDIDKIRQFPIPILSKDKQQAICNYLLYTNNIIDRNIEIISMSNSTIKSIINSIPENNMVELSNFVEICTLKENKTKEIGVIRNGLTAGTVYLNDKELNTNSFYITILDENKMNPMYIFYYLKYNEDKFMEIANLTKQPNLSKLDILGFKIPNIDSKKQEHIVNYCNDFYNNIVKCNIENDAIKQKDIIGTIINLYNI